jgi:hypothetical protein
MGLQQFEQRLEQLVEGVFGRVSRGGLQPVELGRRLTREMDLERTVGMRGLIAPNHFTIRLAPRDRERFEPFEEGLVRELAEGAREHARSEQYHFLGGVEVVMETDPALAPGTFRVVAQTLADAGGVTPTLVLPDGRRVTIDREPFLIGRLPECAVALQDPNVSRRHAEIRRRRDAVVLVDLDSTNGTLVNGSPIQESPLVDGDEVTIGETALRYELA